VSTHPKDTLLQLTKIEMTPSSKLYIQCRTRPLAQASTCAMAANASDDPWRHMRTDTRVTSLVFSNAGVGERDVLQLSRTGGLMFACSSCSPRAAPHLDSVRAVNTMWSLSTSWRLHTIGRTIVPLYSSRVWPVFEEAGPPPRRSRAHGLACTPCSGCPERSRHALCPLHVIKTCVHPASRYLLRPLCPHHHCRLWRTQRIRGHRRCQRGRAKCWRPGAAHARTP